MKLYLQALRLMTWYDDLSLEEAFKILGIEDDLPIVNSRKDQIDYLENKLKIVLPEAA